MNVQPVIPIRLTDDWNLITRTIVPIINQPALFRGGENAFGMGDINPSLFLSPSKPGKFVWGVGPTMTFPTAPSRSSAAGNGARPDGGRSVHGWPWVVGALANQQWSFAGWGGEDVNAMLIQPFVNYNLPRAGISPPHRS